MSQFFASAGQVLEVQLQYSNEYSGLISFRIDWLDLLAAQGTLKSLLQHPQLKINLKTFLYIKLSFPGGSGQRIRLPVKKTQETWVSSLG